MHVDMPPGPAAALRDQVWVELTGGIVVAKLRGTVSVALLECCRLQVLEHFGQATTAVVLYDAMELRGPAPSCYRTDSAQPAVSARVMRGAIALADASLRKALLLACTDLCRESRVFSEDLPVAYDWLSAALPITHRSARR